MRRLLLALTALALFALVASVFADEGKTLEKKPKLELKEIVAPEAPVSKYVFLVLDVSASMESEGKIAKSIEVLHLVCKQPIDEMEMSLVVFNDISFRWPGYNDPKDEKPCPAGWGKLPSLTTLRSAQLWLAAFPGTGGTEPDAALQTALEENRGDKEPITIMLVTDGEFHDNGKTLELVEKQQASREKKGRGKAPFYIFGLGANAENQEHLKTMAKGSQGGFFIEKPKEKEKEKETPASQPTK